MTITDVVSAPSTDPDSIGLDSGTDVPEYESAGQLITIDPHLLVRAPNRPPKPRDPEIYQDIMDHGNYIPIVVSRSATGELEVEDGWNRTLALREGNRNAWVAVLPDNLSHDHKQKVIDRVGRQYSTGRYRFEQSEADRMCAAAMLFDVDASDTLVRKRLGMSKEQVAAARIVAGSERATQTVADNQLDILHAGMAERWADDPDAMQALIDAEAEGRFDHVYQELLDEQEALVAQQLAAEQANTARARIHQAYARTEAEFAARGFEVLTDPPESDDPCYHLLEHLVTQDGSALTEGDVQAHPDRFAVLLVQRITHYETGKLIGPQDVDDHTRMYPEATPIPGLHHFRDVVEHEEFLPHYYCSDLAAGGYTLFEGEDGSSEPDSQDGETASPTAHGDGSTDESIATRSARAEIEYAKARKRAAETARATKLNPKSRSSATVRREKVTEAMFTDRKTVPAGTGELIGLVLERPSLLERFAARTLVDSLGKHIPAEPSSDGIKARDNHGLLRAAVRAVAAIEADILPNETEADGWRRPDPLWARYFRFLESAIDYNKSPYEMILTRELTADQVLAGITRPPAPTTDDQDARSDQDHGPDDQDTSTGSDSPGTPPTDEHTGAVDDVEDVPDAETLADH